MAQDWAADVKKYEPQADDGAITGLVKYLGIALRKPDSALVAMSDAKEAGRVRDNFLKKKLGLTQPDAELDAAIKRVGERMKADRTKSRVTVYYLLAKDFGKLDAFTAAPAKPAAAKAPAKTAAGKTAAARTAGAAAPRTAPAKPAPKPTAAKSPAAKSAAAKPAALKAAAPKPAAKATTGKSAPAKAPVKTAGQPQPTPAPASAPTPTPTPTPTPSPAPSPTPSAAKPRPLASSAPTATNDEGGSMMWLLWVVLALVVLWLVWRFLLS